jgi:hypothetical protein
VSRSETRGARSPWLLAVALASAAAILVLLLGASIVTDHSDFCDSCHEMGPYYTAWSDGPHARDAECIDCHAGQNLGDRLAHKPEALREVAAHLRGDTDFPGDTPPAIPDARCVACHDDVQPDPVEGFSHDRHVEQGPCVGCHRATGHSVTKEALRSAGVLDEAAWEARSIPATAPEAVASWGAGIANVADHVDVDCSSCHDMMRTGCAACHGAPVDDAHEDEQDCLLCHDLTAAWSFQHPSQGDCVSCHQPPDTPAHERAIDCIECHSVQAWDFEHPTTREDCATCHERPDAQGHPQREDCGVCHSIEGQWAHDR